MGAPTGQATLRTERLRLVPLADEHLADEIALDADPEVMRYLDRPRTREEVEARHRIRLEIARRSPGFGLWAGIAADGFAGWWILQPPERPDQGPVQGQAELGYRLQRHRWRQGLGSEGARELLRHAFEDLGLDRVFAETMAVNAASRATMASLGMRHVRSFTQHFDVPLPGAELGEVAYAITRAEWLARRR